MNKIAHDKYCPSCSRFELEVGIKEDSHNCWNCGAEFTQREYELAFAAKHPDIANRRFWVKVYTKVFFRVSLKMLDRMGYHIFKNLADGINGLSKFIGLQENENE